jgi:ATP synthase protein I
MDEDFERRLAAARGRRAPKTATGQSVNASAWGVGTRVGVELLSALVVGLGLGWALDRWLHTAPLMLVVFVLLGGAAGVANVWRLMAPKPAKAADGKGRNSG